MRVVAAFSFVTILIVLLMSYDIIRSAVGVVATPAAVGVGAAIVLSIGGSGAAFAWALFQSAEGRRMKNRQIRAKAQRIEAEALATLRASAGPIIAEANQGVYKTLWQGDQMVEVRRVDLPLPAVNGLPVRLDANQLALLDRWNQYHATSKKDRWEVAPAPPPPAAAGQLGPGLPPLLPRLVGAQRLIIAGNSDAGKTTLIKWMIAHRADHSAIVVIDPHAPSKILGYDCIGAGRDYEAIAAALESLVELMSNRYEDVRLGVMNYGQHQRISVFIDEWTGIVQNIKDAGRLLAILLVESRKVNIHLTVIAHSTTIEALGLPDAQIRKSAMIVELSGGNDGSARRAFVLPAAKTNPDGSKATPTEHALPGPFAGYAQPAPPVVRELPDAKILRALRMDADGASVTAIAKEYFGVDKPNGSQTRQIRDLLKRATEARQGHDNGTTGAR